MNMMMNPAVAIVCGRKVNFRSKNAYRPYLVPAIWHVAYVSFEAMFSGEIESRRDLDLMRRKL